MRAVVQRVTEARVRVGDQISGEIGRGLLVLIGIAEGDDAAAVNYMAGKIAGLRIFDGTGGKGMDRSVADVDGSILVVSQFTLYGDVRRGRRPSFDAAAPPAAARPIYDDLVRELRATGIPVATGEFQAVMRVELVNDGPVTILIESTRHP